MTKKTETKRNKANKTKVEQQNVSNFDLVVRGKCPHDNAKLGNELAGRKVGITRLFEV